uniref:Uncharacterized protein n=1 Tax=Ditylenchus dipsaci TaxID=166011 RepID=A0A915DYV1_9BILA
MKVFDWSNSDVFSWLHQVRDRKLLPKEVGAKILSTYARKVSLKTISRHVPQEPLEALTVIPISTKFGGSMKAVKLGESLFYLYRLHEKTNSRIRE